MLRKKCGPEGDEVTEGWRKQHNEKLNCFVLLIKYYNSGDQIKKDEMGWACGTYGDRRGAYRVLVGKPECKNHLDGLGVDGRDIFMDHIGGGWGGMDWIDLAQDRDR